MTAFPLLYIPFTMLSCTFKPVLLQTGLSYKGRRAPPTV